MTLPAYIHDQAIHLIRAGYSARATMLALKTSGVTVSYTAMDALRRRMIANGEAESRSVAQPAKVQGLRPDDEGLPVNDAGERAAATAGCEALHAATIGLYVRAANQHGLTLQEAALWHHHGPEAVQRWRAAA